MTSQLQPLDVSVNKPFKHLVCKHCDSSPNKNNHILTPSGKIKRASTLIIVEWMSKAWIIGASQYYSKMVFIVSNVEDGTQVCKMTLFGMTVNKVVRVHHHQKKEVRLKDRWTNFLIN
jgi:hypothetical protein